MCVKLNSADFQRGGFVEDDSVVVCQALERAAVDFVEVSGGNYENAGDVFMKTSSTREREGFFLEFAARLKLVLPSMPVMLTGGFRTLEGMNEALTEGKTDLIGLARPFAFDELTALNVLIAGTSLHRPLRSPDTDLVKGPRVFRDLNGGIQAVWYARQIELIARDEPTNPQLSRLTCLLFVIPKYFFHPARYNVPFRLVFALLMLVVVLAVKVLR